MTVQSNKSRRELLRILGMAGIWAVVPSLTPACSRRSKLDSQETQPEPQAVKLRLYGTGTLDIGADKWTRARKDADIDLQFTDNKNDTGPVITQMVSGTAARDYDLGGLQGGAERELAEAGAIIPWDTTKLSNWSKVWSFAREIPYAKFDGKQYGIPSVINADSMIYLPDKVGTIDSYAAVFDPKLKGALRRNPGWLKSTPSHAAVRLRKPSVGVIPESRRAKREC